MKLPHLAALLAVLASASVHAQSFVDYDIRGGSGSKNNSAGLIGQSFTTHASASAITALDLYVNRSGLTNGSDFTLSLYATTGSTGSYSPTGSALFSQTFSNSILAATTGTYATLTGLNWGVTGGTTYLVAVESSAVASVKWTVNLATGGDLANLISGYSGQNRYIAGTGVVSGSYFAMGVTTSAIPEPSTYAAWTGAAVMGFALYRRRRARSRA